MSILASCNDSDENTQENSEQNIVSSARKATVPEHGAKHGLWLAQRAVSYIRKFPTFISFLRSFGIRKTVRIAQSKFRSPQRIRAALYPKQADLDLQKAHGFKYAPAISVIVPLFNTDATHLMETVGSVQAQTYSNWELILVDASNKDEWKREALCKQYSEVDSRICYKRLDKNLGIAGNTNVGLEISTGEYITLLDHDDMLHQSALYEVVKEINETNADLIYTDELNFFGSMQEGYLPHFKPDFSPDTLRSYNYICHMMVYSRELHDICGGMRTECSGSQDYDLVLRLSECAKIISHIPKLLYFWRQHADSYSHDVQQRELCIKASKKALSDHLSRVGLPGRVLDAEAITCYRIKYEITGQPLVSIIIPNCDHVSDLKKCLESVLTKTSYQNYEIVIIENNSTNPDTFRFYEQLNDPHISVLNYQGEFNFSAINNYAARKAKGEYLLFLNNDTEVIIPEWLDEMLIFAQRTDVGAVGAKLYYLDDTIQHAGIILKIGGTAGHAHRGFERESPGYSNRLKLVQNVSAVTAACLMVSKDKFFDVGGFTESFVVALNDVDLCLKLRRQDYLNIFTPYAELYHFESKSRGYEDSPEKKARLARETAHFHEIWADVIDTGDPYYNPNLTLDLEDFSLG